MTPSVLAFPPADGAVDVAITIAVMVIAFIGWIVQLAGKVKAQPGAPAQRPQPIGQRPGAPAPAANRPRDGRLQSEIDAFLREVSTGRKSPQPVEEDAIEVIDDDEPAQPFRRASLPFPSAETNRDREQQRRSERPASTLSNRHLEPAPLQKHAAGHAHESAKLRQEKEQTERRLAETRAELQSMRSQTGSVSSAAPLAAGPSGTSRFANLLKDRKSIKDAIVINEILSRPKGLTRGR